MPTVLQYGYKRARGVQDNMMRIYQKHFSYFTCPNSFYPERIINSDPPDFGLRQTKQMATHEGNQELTKEDVEELKEFAREYGRGVRQDNVRSMTKELTGTLPYALSLRPTVIPTVDTNEDVVTACQEQELNLVTRSHPVVTKTRCSITMPSPASKGPDHKREEYYILDHRRATSRRDAFSPRE